MVLAKRRKNCSHSKWYWVIYQHIKLEKIFMARMNVCGAVFVRACMCVCVIAKRSYVLNITLYLLYNRTWPILMGIHFFQMKLLVDVCRVQRFFEVVRPRPECAISYLVSCFFSCFFSSLCECNACVLVCLSLCVCKFELCQYSEMQ